MNETNQIIEIIGYLAMILVALAMVFTSIIRLRWFSLFGSALFTIYGFTIGAYPVGAVNGFIMITNLVFLIKIYAKKESFKTLKIKPDNKYLQNFIDFHATDIQKFFPNFNKDVEYSTALLILRDMQVSGIFLAKRNKHQLEIVLDYVIPQYRDFKLGNYIYNGQINEFKEEGISQFVSDKQSKMNDKYLMKLGFKLVLEEEKMVLVKTL